MINVKKAFLEHFKDEEFVAPELVAHENRDFQPPDSGLWASVLFAPASFTVDALGADGFDRVNGFFQIILYVPVGDGDGVLQEKAHNIRKAYPAGKILSYDEQQVTIKGCSIGSGIITGNRYAVTLRISFYAFLNRAQI